MADQIAFLKNAIFWTMLCHKSMKLVSLMQLWSIGITDKVSYALLIVCMSALSGNNLYACI